MLVAARNEEKNKSVRSSVKTSIKKVLAAVESGDKADAQAKLQDATKTIDMACQKGVYHKNNASRKVSRISSAVSSMK